MEARTVVEVVCALLEDNRGRLLVARRPLGKHLAGLWEFPGGKIEPGETPQAALRRELREELGCEAEPGAALAPVTHTYPAVTVKLMPYLARLVPGGPPPVAREHDALAWVGPDEIGAFAMPEADAPIVAEWRALRGRA